MPHSKLEDLPTATSRGWRSAEGRFRAAHWGDMEVCFTTIDAPIDCTNLYRLGRLPGGVCPCPHYFFVFEGHIRCTWPGSDKPDEVVESGDVCYFPAGHVLIYDKPSRVLELNPAASLKECMEGMQRTADMYADRIPPKPQGI